jgi:hypothetical protein
MHIVYSRLVPNVCYEGFFKDMHELRCGLMASSFFCYILHLFSQGYEIQLDWLAFRIHAEAMKYQYGR